MYQTDLTGTGRQYIIKVLNLQERKRKYDLWIIGNAIFYLVKTGCQWCMLPKKSEWASMEEFDLLLRNATPGKSEKYNCIWLRILKYLWRDTVVFDLYWKQFISKKHTIFFHRLMPSAVSTNILSMCCDSWKLKRCLLLHAEEVQTADWVEA